MQSWQEGRNWVEKVHKQQGWPQAWEYCQAKLIQTLGRASQGVNWSWSQCIKSHHAQTYSGKPSHFWNRNNVRSILPGLRRKRTGLLLNGPKSFQLYGDADYLFQQDFSTCPQCQNHFQVLCWPWYYCAWLARQQAWPEPHLESTGYFQEKDEKQSIQQSRRAEGSIVPQQCHRLIASMPHLTDVFVLKEPWSSIEWINEHTLNNLHFSVVQILFYLR